MKTARKPTPRRSSPPTTPPAIAPTGVLLPEAVEDTSEVAVAPELVASAVVLDAAVLVVDVGASLARPAVVVAVISPLPLVTEDEYTLIEAGLNEVELPRQLSSEED